MALRFELSAGGTATLVDTDGDKVTLLSSRAFPPGSTLRAEGTGDARAYAVKVRSCQKDGENGFVVGGRWVSLSREQREFLRAGLRAE